MAGRFCGQPKANGDPCRNPAGHCRFHKPGVASTVIEMQRPGGGYGSAWPAEAKLEAAGHLAAGKSADEAGRLTGIPGSTVRQWRREDAEFAALVARMNEELVTEAVYGLGSIARKAVATLDAGMDGKAKPIQVRAADVTLAKLAALRTFRPEPQAEEKAHGIRIVFEQRHGEQPTTTDDLI